MIRWRPFLEVLEDRLVPTGDLLTFALGAGGRDLAEGIVADAAGNIYVTGEFDDTVDFDPGLGTTELTSGGGRDIFVAKYTPTGELLWARGFGSGGSDYGYDVVLDSENNVLVTGGFQDTVTFDAISLTGAGQQDAFVLKLDSDGVVQFAVGFGGSLGDVGQSLAVDSEDNIYACGYFSTTADFDVTTLTAAGGLEGFLAMIDADGNVLSAHRFGGTIDDTVNDVAIDGEGHLHITGYIMGQVSFGSFTLNSANGYDIYVAELDENGAVLSAQRFGSNGFDVAHALAVDDAGDVYVTGYINGLTTFGGFQLIPTGNNEVFVIKVDGADGSVLYADNFSVVGGESVSFGITVDVANRAHVAGLFEGTTSFGALSRTSAGGRDAFVAVLDAAGAVEFVQQFGGPLEDTGADVAVDAAGNILFAGAFKGTATFGDETRTSAGDFDAFFLKIVTNTAPTITGTLQQTVGDDQTITPFAESENGVSVADAENNLLTATLTFAADEGAFTTASLMASGFSGTDGSYSRTGTPTEITSALRSLVFAPTDNLTDVGASTTTTFTLTLSDGIAPDVTDATTTVTATSVNDAPTIANADLELSATSIVENSSVTLDGSFLDGDPNDAHTVVVNWGAGETPSTINLNPGVFTFSVSHQYLDNKTPNITVTVTDASNASASASTNVTVLNAPPVVNIINGPMVGVPGQRLRYVGSFTDVGTLDTHTLTWQVRNSTNAVVATGTGSSFDFTPSLPGTFTVRFTVTDDDGGSQTASLTLTVTSVLLGEFQGDATTLLVGGSPNNDTLQIKPRGTAGDVRVFIAGLDRGTFTAASFTSMALFGLGGNDTLKAAAVAKPASLFGGAGNDKLKASAGGSLLVGDTGNDVLTGNVGRDVLLGGAGVDQLLGHGGEDVLVAGTTTFTDPETALVAVLAEWRSPRDQATRIDNLRGVGTGSRLNQDFFLSAATVGDDAARDTLTGGSALDWFFANRDTGVKDVLADRLQSERFDELS